MSKKEGFQRMATKIFIELRGLDYEERERIRADKVELGLRNIGGTEGVNRRHNSQIVMGKHVNANDFLLNRNATT